MVRIREVQNADLDAILRFTDRNIGQDYFSEKKLREILQSSHKNGVMCSFVLEDSAGLQGVRLTTAPEQWLSRHPSQPIHPELWQIPFEQVAYFQSLFVSDAYQKQGWGRRLSMASIENLRKLKVEAVVCHSWDESPGNSSRKYLEKLGFEPVTSIARYWHEIDYECTRCGRPCACTATEMILYLNKRAERDREQCERGARRL